MISEDETLTNTESSTVIEPTESNAAEIDQETGTEIDETTETEALLEGIPSVTDKPSLIGKVFVGFYVAIFGWFILHSFLYFWDLMIPSNIDWMDYFFFYGTYIVAIFLFGLILALLVAILLLPAFSDKKSMRWPLRTFGLFAVQLFWWSNLASEPLTRIGSAWFTADDLRYPSFMSRKGFFPIFLFFINDMAASFGSDLDGASSTHLFRPFWKSLLLGCSMFKENLTGILACLYIYASYWYLVFAVTDSWIEFLAVIVGIWMARSSFGNGSNFESDRRKFSLFFVPVLVLIRAYFSYYEWQAHGPMWLFAVKLVYCLSHLIIFAGWYCPPLSMMATIFLPFIPICESKKDEDDEEDDEEDEDENVAVTYDTSVVNSESAVAADVNYENAVTADVMKSETDDSDEMARSPTSSRFKKED